MPAARVPASVRLGTGTEDDGDPRLQDTAAHSLPDGAGADDVTMAAVPAARVGWESMEPGTRQLTATAARVNRSQRHLGATIRLDLAWRQAPPPNNDTAKVDFSRSGRLPAFIVLSPAGVIV